MASKMCELRADAARWMHSRTLKPKGKRKSAAKGGMKKRRRRKYNFGHLKGARNRCVCSQNCICDCPIVVKSKQVQTDTVLTAVKMVNKSTSIKHKKNLPAAGTYTVSDRRFEKCGAALRRLKRAIPVGFHWSSAMIAVCLRLVFSGVYNCHWTWTEAVHFASKAVNLRKNTVFEYANNYLGNTDNVWPIERVMKVRGRGSAVFIVNHGKDKYSALKEVLTPFCLFDFNLFLACLLVCTYLFFFCVFAHRCTWRPSSSS